MNKRLTIIAVLFIITSITRAENYKPKITDKVITALNFSLNQYKLMIASLPDSTRFPRRTSSSTNSTLTTVTASDWTSGFFPGCLWYLYEYSGDNYWKRNALRWTGNLLSQQTSSGQGHDVGFVMNCSYGNAFRMTGNPYNMPIIVQSGKTLSNLFSNAVGCTKSWTWSGSWTSPSTNTGSWKFPVIIDNMMNLELLMKTFHMTNDSLFYKQAVSHARTTTLNHIRPDSSMYHVVDYDNISGLVRAKGTRQGLSDASCWSRGQAWGIYGYTTMYTYSRDSLFLKTAKKLLGYYQKRTPADYIPFWDYNDTKIPNTIKDASAAAIMASALIDLYQITNDSTYIIVAENIIQTLSTAAYTNSLGTKANFVLTHSTGGLNYETDLPLIYADYYYFEALIKYLKLDRNYQFANHSPEIHTLRTDVATKGSWYKFQLQMFDYDRDVIKVSSVNLPQGLSVSENGLISGIPQSFGTYKVDFKATDGKAETVFSLNMTITGVSGIDERESNAIKINGNRMCGGITIQMLTDLKYRDLKVSVFSISGQLILSKTIDLNRNSSLIPIKNSGIYFVELLEKDQLVAKKKIILL